ncbi:MAG: hypothetical protein FJ405_12365, partial [Verrucomicrobia bacterium]|nr:hypothetical protein [Verrucomicrobiota bacterium]
MKCVVLCASLLASFSLPLLADSIVVFNEIMYQPATAEANAEWVELHNQNAVDVDLSGWSIANGISFTFPEGTRLRGKGYLVVALNPSWLATNAGVTTALGPFTGRLANGGERIELKDRNQRVMDSVRYNNDGFWPQAPAGTGLSLAKRDPNLGGSRGESWVQSAQIGGTPGLRNFPSGLFEPQPGLVAYWPLNELSGPADDLTSPINARPTGGLSQTTELISGSLRFPPSGSGSLDLGRDIGDRLSPDSGFTFTALLQPTWNGSGRATVFRKEADRSGTLAAYWSFDEASTGTNAALELVNKNHGFFRTGTVRTNGLQGLGAALFRNGGSEGISVGTGVSNSFSFTQGITLSAWIRLQWNAATNTYDAIFAKDDGTNRITFGFQHDASNSLGIVVAPPGPVLAFGANIAGTYTELDLALDGQNGRPTLDQLRDGNAHHVAATFDSTTGNMEIWVDGTRSIVATKPGQLRTGGNASAFIGNRSASGTSAAFTGVIDEMAIWSSALNAAEISRLAGGASPPELAPTVDGGNRIQFGFRLQGDVDFTDPPVGTTPALGLEFRTTSGFQRLEVLLDGQGSRPTLAALQARPTHVAAFYDPARRSMGIALDGIVIGSGTAEGRLDAAGIGASFIGNASSAGSEPYRGLLDEPTLWARALTQTELDRHARLARANKPFYAPDIQSLPALAFSELEPPNSNNYWIELVNHGSTPLELGGILLGSSSGGLFVFPQGLLEPASYLVLTQNTFGFRPQAGDLLSLYTPGRTHVIDSVRVNAGAFARVTPGLSPWRIPRTSTPGGPNTFTFRDQVVINEVFYKAPPIYSVPAQSTNITLVAMESDWRYHQAGEDLGTAWSETSFDDSAWPVGKALFYNETANLPATKNTPLNLGPITYYFRKTFTVDYAPSNVVLRIRTILDDGAVVHINGAPVARINMRSGPVTYTNLAQNVNNATLSSWTTLVVSNLVQGENLLAVELHQTAINSDDAVFGLELDARVPFTPGRAFAENSEQWIELHNRTGSAVDLSGWRLDAGVNFTIPAGTSLPPQGYLVVASDPTTLNAKYPGLGALGPWARRLSGSSDRISLVDDSGNPVDEVRYYNSGYWPEAADGGGSSLE